MNTVEKIRSICKSRKIPISRLEKECEFANGYIAQLRKGTVPSDRLQRIAVFLEVPITELLDDLYTEQPDLTIRSGSKELELLIEKARNMDQERLHQLLSYAEFLTSGN